MALRFSYVFNLSFFLVHFLNNAVNCLQKHDCEVASEDLFLAQRSMVPKFGKSPTVAKFDSEEKVKQFIQDATNVYHEIVRGNNYNSIDPFIQFYKDSIDTFNENPELMMPFFIKYQYKFRPRENGLSLAVELLNEISAMKDKYPEIENKGYLATSPSAFDQESIKHLAIPDEETLRSRIHAKKLINAVAVFKIEVEKKTIFVIFNTVYYYSKPIVLVQGFPEDPLNNLVGESRTSKYVHRFFKEIGENYLLVNVYLKSNPEALYCSEIIYIGESYCSFMDTTDKRYLVYPLKGIFIQGKEQELTGFQFNLQSIANGEPAVLYSYYFTKYNDTDIVNEQNFQIDTTKSGPFDEDLIDIRKQRLVKIVDAIGMKYEDLISKLTSLREILANRVFLKTIMELNDIMYQDKPEQVDLALTMEEEIKKSKRESEVKADGEVKAEGEVKTAD